MRLFGQQNEEVPELERQSTTVKTILEPRALVEKQQPLQKLAPEPGPLPCSRMLTSQLYWASSEPSSVRQTQLSFELHLEPAHCLKEKVSLLAEVKVYLVSAPAP